MTFAQKTLVSFDIAIDTRENASSPFFRDYLLKESLRVAIMKLDEGDFYIPSKTGAFRGVIVERKTWNDLTNSIVDKRIWLQAKRLKEIREESSVKVYVVIEGDPQDVRENRDMSFNSLLSVLDALQNSFQFTVLYMPDKQSLAEWLKYMIHKQKEAEAYVGKAAEPLIVQKPIKKISVDDRVKAVLQVLVGPTLGERLLRKFGSLRNIANASIAELMTVEGIGENRAKELYLIFNKKLGK